MLDLLLAEFFERFLEFRLVLAEGVDLALVMLVDHFFDSDRAGHRRALAHQRGRGAERKARDMPDRRQRRRPHATVENQLLERIEMALLLLGHVADFLRSAVAAAAEHGKLAVIDALGAVFAGMIDANDARDFTFGAGVARKPLHDASPRRAIAKLKTASTIEAMKLRPASEMPKIDHCTTSHCTGWRASSILRSWSGEEAWPMPPVQAVGPAIQCCSTAT